MEEWINNLIFFINFSIFIEINNCLVEFDGSILVENFFVFMLYNVVNILLIFVVIMVNFFVLWVIKERFFLYILFLVFLFILVLFDFVIGVFV